MLKTLQDNQESAVDNQIHKELDVENDHPKVWGGILSRSVSSLSAYLVDNLCNV